jgi:salicylate hydroxylase
MALIGADGNASTVRDSVFAVETVNYTGQVAFLALIPAKKVNDILEGEDKRLYIGPGRMFLQYYVRRDEILNVIGIGREPRWQAEGWSIPATVEEFLALYSDFHPFVRQVISRIPEGNLFKWGLRDREPMPVWVKGRVATLGDAAHPLTPFLGQGACMAIEDGMVLGRCFAKYRPDVNLALRRYEAARRERGNGVQLASREQAEALQGKKNNPEAFSPGRSPIERGLFAYNPLAAEI